jgi:hypothetical protein
MKNGVDWWWWFWLIQARTQDGPKVNNGGSRVGVWKLRGEIGTISLVDRLRELV